MFNKYYQDELAYLRELGHDFAQSYPALAPMLADRGGDPDVERLLEGVAFLTGRIRQKLDDELPEVVLAMAQLLFPHLMRSLPAAAILEMSPLPNVLRERRLVPAGTEFGSIPVDGTTCRFRSCFDCELVPWTIEDVRLEALPAARQQLRIEFQVPMGLALDAIAPSKLRLHLAGEERISLALLMWILTRTEQVVLIESKPGGAGEREIALGKQAIEPVGFEENQALLPFGRTAFPGFRLLEEYYVLPSKFAFLDIAHIDRVSQLDKQLTRFALAFRFDSTFPTVPRLTRDAIKLHCVPIVNIFETTAEPIRLTPMREQFVVRPAGLAPTHGEVYTIQKVEAISRGTSERLLIPSFFEFSHADPQSKQPRLFYTQHLRPSVVDDGADMLVSFGTPEEQGVVPEASVISLDVLATNRRLASALRAGEIRIATPSSPPVVTFKNLTAVTAHVPPPLGRELYWRVIAHAAMGLRSLTEPDVLRAVLDVYNLHALVDRQAARANQLRIAAVRDVRVRPTERLYRGAPVRGVAIDVDLDESGFSSEGDMHLFGSVLERFFGAYVSINSFSKTTINGVQSKVHYTWPARSGNLTLL